MLWPEADTVCCGQRPQHLKSKSRRYWRQSLFVVAINLNNLKVHRTGKFGHCGYKIKHDISTSGGQVNRHCQ